MKKYTYRAAAVLGAMLSPVLALAQQAPSSGSASADRLDALYAQVEALRAEIASLKAAQQTAPGAPSVQASGISASDRKNAVRIGSNAEVSLYGRLLATVENVQLKDSPVATTNLSRNRVTTSNSNIGVRGELDLGGGNALFFQAEQTVSLDGTGTNTFADRDSGVGFKGSWGRVLAGKWNTPYKNQSIKVDPFDEVTIASEQFVLGQTSRDAVGDFHRRESNAIQYWTPSFKGMSGKLHYSANEGKTSTTNPYSLSLGLDYDKGPLFAFVGYETHKDSGKLTAGATGIDKGTHVGGGYRFDATTVSLAWEQLKYQSDALGATATNDLSRNAWFLGATHKFNRVILRGAYGSAGNQTGSNSAAGPNTGARAYFVGVGYALNGFDAFDRTEIFANYTHVGNDSDATYGVGNNPTANGLDMVKTGARTAGAAINGAMIGVRSFF
jgi:predicted porin